MSDLKADPSTPETEGVAVSTKTKRQIWEQFKRFYQDRIVRGIALLIASLVAVIVAAGDFAPATGVDLLRFRLMKDATIGVSASPWMWGLMIFWGFVFYWFFLPRGQPWEATEINFEVAKIGKIVLKPNQETAGLAHRAWSEIMTRKAGVPFDEDHDVISEVYDSWYVLFAEFRALIKAIPIDKLRTSEDAQQLCTLLVNVLNIVLRPHLTQYQARFRQWFQIESQKHPDESPQDIQRRFPEYSELLVDLKKTNATFVDFASQLEMIARGKVSV